MTLELQKDFKKPYRRKRFKKIIPEWVGRDFDIPFTFGVKNGVLNININQEQKQFSFSISKIKNKQKGITYKISYRITNSGFMTYSTYEGEDKLWKTVTEMYGWIKERMIADGLLTREELMIQDIIE